MAGEWLKWCVGLPHKTEVLHMSELLEMDPYAVAAHLADDVWSWAREQTTDGKIGNARTVTTLRHIDRKTGVVGFADAMQKAGWLVVENDAIVFPHWEDHLSNSAKERALSQRRQAKWKKNQSRKSNARTVTKTSLEKRREDIPPNPPRGEQQNTAGQTIRWVGSTKRTLAKKAKVTRSRQ
jgi:hypothetical protein